MGILNSSKKRTKKFDLTTMIPQIELFSFVFRKNLKTTKGHFEINWPLPLVSQWVKILFNSHYHNKFHAILACKFNYYLVKSLGLPTTHKITFYNLGTLEELIKQFWGSKAALFVDVEVKEIFKKSKFLSPKIDLLVDFLGSIVYKVSSKPRNSFIVHSKVHM